MGILSTLFGLYAAPRKLLCVAGGLCIFGVTVHFGVVKPMQSNRETIHLLGSQPLMEANKGSPYEARSDTPYLVRDFDRTTVIPSMARTLSIQHLQPDTKAQFINDFSGSIRQHLLNDTLPTKREFRSKFLEQSHKLNKFGTSVSWASSTDVTYRSTFYNEQVGSLDIHHLVQDILWSLAEESSENRTIIRTGSIDVDFQLEKVQQSADSEENDTFPVPANRIKNLRIRFKVYNPNNEARTVFKSIPLLPYQECDLSVSIKNAELRPFLVSPNPLTNQNQSKWGLIPSEGQKFEIKQVTLSPSPSSKIFFLDRLSLIYGSSKFLNKILNRSSPIITSPSYQDFLQIATPYVMQLTKDQIKKDLEVWYGSAFAFQMHLRMKDVQKLVDIMDVAIFRDAAGQDKSGLSMLVNSKNWRNNLYNMLQLNLDWIRVLEGFFEEGERQIKLKEIRALFKSILYNMNKMRDAMKIKLTWEKEPELSFSGSEDSSPFPAVSFKLSRELTWTDKVEIPFKGCWDDSKNEFKTATSANCCSETQYFDFSKKLDNLSQLLNPIAQMISPMIMNLLPDANQFVGWTNWEIEKDEQIKTTYEALKSPIRPALSFSYDYQDPNDAAPGWKALDVTVTYDLSKFHKMFYKVYEKIDMFKDYSGPNITSSFSALWNSSSMLSTIQKAATEKPISFAVHMINQLWNLGYWNKNENGKEAAEEQRPWPVFFKSLLGQPLKVESTQMFAGYSSSMYDIESWLYEKLSTTTGSSKEYDVKKDWQSKDVNGKKAFSDSEWSFPGKIKGEKLNNFVKNFRHSYSYAFPKEPIIFWPSYGTEWNTFLNREGSTNTGFINHRDRIKNLLRDMVYAKPTPSTVRSFPAPQWVDWEKVKVSFTQLRMEEAFKSVLNMRNNLATLVDSALNVPFNNVLGEFIRRDAMMITVNMMMEEGSIVVKKDPIMMLMFSENSTFSLFVSPHFDHTKLHTSLHKHVPALKPKE